MGPLGWRRTLLHQSVRILPTCEHILKMNESILMQTGTSRAWARA